MSKYRIAKKGNIDGLHKHFLRAELPKKEKFDSLHKHC